MRAYSGSSLGRPLVFFSLFSLYLLVFSITPIWIHFAGPVRQGLVLPAITAAGLFWAAASSGSVSLRWKTALPWFLGFLAAALALNHQSLSSSIPWRGDEDHHIVFAWDLARLLEARPAYLLLPALPILLTALLARGNPGKARLFVGALALALLAPLLALTADIDASPEDVWYHILRYPILLKYLTAVPAYLGTLLPADLPREWAYRLLPLASAAGLATLAALELRRHAFGLRLAAGIALLTLPLVRYYSSIFYLEMPAVFCMTWAALRADRLLRADPARLVSMPAWYALLLVGFMKETTLPFLVAFCACRLAARAALLRKNGPPAFRTLLSEVGVLYAVCLPLFLYLLFRSHFGDPRPVGFALSHLRNPELAWRLLQSLFTSFAVLLPFALAGLYYAIRSSPSHLLPPAFLLLAAALNAALHYLDDPAYIGYSRFNLFLLPSLAALALFATRRTAHRHPSLAASLLVLVLATNALLSPILPDGSKKPLWSIYGADTGEHYYPYRDALQTLMEKHMGEDVLLTGHHYGYLARFYTGRLEWPAQRLVSAEPGDETARIDSALSAAAQSGRRAVLYHFLGPKYRLPEKLHGYGKTQVFRNDAHTLVLFSR